jgi:glycerate 2-kinase
VSGFDVVADELDLDDRIAEVDLVVTGEGFVDAQSFEGKVVGGVTALAAEAGVPVLAVAGEVFDGADAKVATVSLVERFGRDRALDDPLGCIEEAVGEWLRAWSARTR